MNNEIIKDGNDFYVKRKDKKMKDYNVKTYNENNKPKHFYKRVINFIKAYLNTNMEKK